MKNSYNKTKWIDKKTPVCARSLNKIEDALGDLYANAIDSREIEEGDGINIENTDEGFSFNVDESVMRSDSCTGIEWTTEEPGTFEEKTLYFILDPETGQLDRIMLNGITIFKI